MLKISRPVSNRARKPRLRVRALAIVWNNITIKISPKIVKLNSDKFTFLNLWEDLTSYTIGIISPDRLGLLWVEQFRKKFINEKGLLIQQE